MNSLDLDSFEDIKDITFDLGHTSSHNNKGFSRPNLITRDPPSRSPTNDSSFGLDLIMNKEKQKRKPSPSSSPSSFSPIPLDEPKSSFSNNMYSKIDNKTPSFGSGNGREKFNMDAYLEDELADLTSKPSITKMGGSHSSSPIELLPPSGNGFNFDDDILGDNSNSNSNQNNQNSNQNNYSNSNSNSNNNYETNTIQNTTSLDNLLNTSLDTILNEKAELKNIEIDLHNVVFKVLKTDIPDIYNLYCNDMNKNLIKHAIALIPTIKTSHLLYYTFNSKSNNLGLTMECKFSKIFEKWIPLRFVEHTIFDKHTIETLETKLKDNVK